MAVLISASLAGCAGKQTAQDDAICPGKQIGDEGASPTRADGLDPNVDMRFNTVDTKGNSVTNEIFAGTEKGVWLVFWQTDNDKSASELKRLHDMLAIAEENACKIVGIVMDGEKNADKAKEMTQDLGFSNLLWNDAVAARFDGVAQFFSEQFYLENQSDLEQLNPKASCGDPVSTRANSRGQIQPSCTLISMSNETMEQLMQDNDSNSTYEELQEQEKTLLGK